MALQVYWNQEEKKESEVSAGAAAVVEIEAAGAVDDGDRHPPGTSEKSAYFGRGEIAKRPQRNGQPDRWQQQLRRTVAMLSGALIGGIGQMRRPVVLEPVKSQTKSAGRFR